MKFYFIFFGFVIFSIFFAGCGKDKTVSNPFVPKGKVLVGVNVGANNIFNYYGRGEKYNTVDSLVCDTNFYLIPYPPTNGYQFNGINLTFKAAFDTSYNCQYQWKIGDDQTERISSQFSLFFDKTYPKIQVRLITRYSPKNGSGVSGTDTTFQQISIGDVPPLFGEYEGANSDDPSHKFRIKIGWDFEANPAVNRNAFYLFNLPEGYPIKSEISLPRGTCFGIDDATIRGGQALYYKQEWVNCVYAIGFMNKTQDSIRIRYNYGIIANYPNNSSDWSRVVAHEFLGKKL